MASSAQWQLNFPESFVYEPRESRVLSFGVDYTPPAKSGASSRAPRNKQAEKDATFIASTTRDLMIGDHKDLVNVCTVSDDSDKCTAAGIEKAFNHALSCVGKNGLFVFMFVGSAMKVAGEYSLVLTDFDATNVGTHITPEVMIKWISSHDNLPKHVVLVFNCPFANKLGEEMTSGANYLQLKDKISICTLGVTVGLENPSGLIYDTLEHSFFAFFFDHFLRKASRSQPGNFILKEAFTQITECCEALSSLVVTYKDGKLQSNMMESIQAALKRDRVEIDTAVDIGRFDFLTKHAVDLSTKHKVNLHYMVDAFFGWVSEFNCGALWTLKKNGVLTNSMLTASFCMMMLSVASFQVAEDKQSLQEPSLFYQAFMRVASTIELVYKYREMDEKVEHPEIQYVQMFRRSVDFYVQVLKENKIKDKKLQEYLRKVNTEIATIA